MGFLSKLINKSNIKIINYENGAIYEGEVLNDKRHGQGTLKTQNTTYVGDWKENLKEGYGVCTWNNGDVYEGDWLRDYREGFGKYKWPNGNIYEGRWREGKRDGFGKFIYYNGAVYEGQWKNSKREGEGVCIYDDGSEYRGIWNSDEKSGKGIMNWNNGNSYDGEWMNGQLDGFGVYKWANGDIYKGNWKESMKNGKGTVHLHNGEIYNGEWLMGKRNGFGICKWANENIYEGQWKDNNIEGKGVLKTPDGGVYDGEWKNNKMDGEGIIKDSDGSEYNGQWTNGMKNGFGKQIWPNGDVYEGQWFDDHMNGKGIMKYANGEVYNGYWEEDKKVIKVTESTEIILKKVEENDENLEELLNKLNSLVALEEVKDKINSLINMMKIRKIRKEKGISMDPITLNMIFTGNIGTGKSTVGKLIGKIYNQLGVLESSKFIEVKWSRLVDSHHGSVTKKLEDVIKEALGGVLFIDEVHLIKDETEENEHKEILETLLKLIEENKENLMVILSGSKDEIIEFIEKNKVLKSYFREFITFVDYSGEELKEILNLEIENYDLKLTEEAKIEIQELFDYIVNTKEDRFINGRIIRKILEDLLKIQADRLSGKLSLIANNADFMQSFIKDDIKELKNMYK